MNRMYFNLTRILNGWVLEYSPYLYEADTNMTSDSAREYFRTLPEVYEFVSAHTDAVKKFDSISLRHLFRE